MKVILAETAGFCYGVERAVNLARETAKARGGAMLGSIVHNAGVVREIEDLGMRLITSPDQAKAGESVLIRAHGESRATLDALRERGAEVVSAVCPHVERIRKLAQEAEHEGRRVILIGERHHPEVQGIAGWCSDPLIFENVQEAQKYLQEHPDFAHLPSIMLAQTTCIRALWESCVKFLKKQCTNLKINDTICNATQKRQTEAAELSAKVDAMVVVGDRRSANTRHLTEICRENCGKVLQIESADELSPEFFSGCRVAGLTAGASTPASIIMEVLTTMTEENINTTAPETSESFEELLEKSFKTLNTGDKVTGIVTAIGTTEIQVDVGCKQAGYIPVSELSSDPDVKPEDVVKVGDEIETYIIRVNDVEGYAMLSKKRLDAAKSWNDIEEAAESGAVLEGVVSGENKGGVVVNVKGVSVFVPASQTDLPRDAELSQLIKKTVRLKITEVNKARKRVVGSIRRVAQAERRERIESIWNEIEVGKKYHGVVKSLTSYGAFVDIGGIDGMVHVSELSWSRIKQPSDVLSVGDEVDVYVISFDKEKRKISLGYKDPNGNPWTVFTNTYGVGSVAKVTIVKLMPFGAFAEVLPGVDGLIHISQIANRRIGKPEDVLTVGDVVDAKITAIDDEKHKISLSIRALSEPAPAAVEEEEEEVEEPAGDALIYEVSATGEATGIAPEEE